MLPKEQAEGRAAVDRWGNPIQQDDEPKKEPVYDWQAKDGEILGRKLERAGDKPVPSKLAYFRPLRPGETLRYEFFHEPGKTHVHPSLGRLAFLLEPDGVKLHWLTDTDGRRLDRADGRQRRRRPGRPQRRQAAAQGRRLERRRR